MLLNHSKLVKWSLPSLALILGLLWYKRRRVDRVDPGGSSNPIAKKSQKADVHKKTTSATTIIKAAADPLLQAIISPIKKVQSVGNNCSSSNNKHSDSGINSDESLNLSGNNITVQEVSSSTSPRKVSESLDIPGRSCMQKTIATTTFSTTSWYEDEEEEVEEIEKKRSPIEILSSQPAKKGADLLSKSRTSAELIANATVMKGRQNEQTRQQKQAKIVVAKGTPKVQTFQNKCEEEKIKKNQESETTSAASASSMTEIIVQVVDSSTTVDNDKIKTVVDEKNKENHVVSERDSANHSPVSAVLEGSVTDEARSEGEGSTDSGKGGSINGRNNNGNNRTFYEFAIQSKLVGKLIGKGGRSLEQVRNKANVGVVVKDHPTDCSYHICNINGTPENIRTALGLIRKNFPEKQYPQLTLEQIIYEELIIPEEINWIPELIQLSLIEGVNNDVVVCNITAPNHLFIQLPTHPTYPSLRILTERMTREYETVESPPVPEELTKGMIVVAKFFDKWVRVNVENPDPQGEQTLVRLIDLGGYYTFSNAEMRKIRADYLSLPFQAIEVYLANVQPKDEEWSQEAFDVVAKLSSNGVGQAHIIGYTEYNTYINLYYKLHKHGILSVADELIARNLAQPMFTQEQVIEQEVQPICIDSHITGSVQPVQPIV